MMLLRILSNNKTQTIMKTLKNTGFIFVLFATLGTINAQGVPSSEQIYNTTTNFWYENNLVGFTTYTTNLYSGASTNFVAPILLSAFHDYMFLGELVSSSNKYASVQSKVEASPNRFTDLFKGFLSLVLNSVTGDIKRYNDLNKPLNDAKTLASPQTIRDITANSPFVIPHLMILNHAPNIEVQ